MSYTDDVLLLKSKAKALEHSFFARENERILREMREASVREEKKKEFREYLAIDDEEIINALADLEVEPETLVAFSLVPMVEVAWADGEIQHEEREAIIKAAVERGVDESSPTCDLLRNWLQTKPSPELLEVWKSYIEALKPSLGESAKAHLRDGTLGRARDIADAAGGFLGVATISAAEKKMLEELEQAFD